jgi:ribosomal protein S27AE
VSQDEAERTIVAGKPLLCGHCGHDRFNHRKVILNSRMKALFDFGWLAPRADVYACGRCGWLVWFKPPKKD